MGKSVKGKLLTELALILRCNSIKKQVPEGARKRLSKKGEYQVQFPKAQRNSMVGAKSIRCTKAG